MADKVVYPAPDSDTPIWTPGDRLVDPDGNPFGSLAILGQASGASQGSVGPGTVTPINWTWPVGTQLLRLSGAMNCLATAGNGVAAAGHINAIVDVTTDVIHGASSQAFANAAGDRESRAWNAVALAIPVANHVMTFFGSGQQAYIGAYNPATRNITIVLAISATTAWSFSMFIEALG